VSSFEPSNWTSRRRRVPTTAASDRRVRQALAEELCLDLSGSALTRRRSDVITSSRRLVVVGRSCRSCSGSVVVASGAGGATSRPQWVSPDHQTTGRCDNVVEKVSSRRSGRSCIICIISCSGCVVVASGAGGAMSRPQWVSPDHQTMRRCDNVVEKVSSRRRSRSCLSCGGSVVVALSRPQWVSPDHLSCDSAESQTHSSDL